MLTKEETKKILYIMCNCFQNFRPSNIAETTEVWEMMLSDYTYQQISVALKSYILSDTSGFAPTIGQLVDMVHSVSKPQELNEMEAWALVSKAIRNSGYRYTEEFLKLPTIIQRAIGTPEQLHIWAIDEDYNETVVMSNFQRSYRLVLMQKDESAKLPTEAQNLLSNNENPARIEMQDRIKQLSNAFDEKSKLLIEGGEKKERVVDDSVMDTVHAELEKIKAMSIR